MATRITPGFYDYLHKLIAAGTPPVSPPLVKPPIATAFGPAWHSRRGITSIAVRFDRPLVPNSAKKRRQYDVTAAMKRMKGRDVMDQEALRIARVAYNGDLHSHGLPRPPGKGPET